MMLGPRSRSGCKGGKWQREQERRAPRPARRAAHARHMRQAWRGRCAGGWLVGAMARWRDRSQSRLAPESLTMRPRRGTSVRSSWQRPQACRPAHRPPERSFVGHIGLLQGQV